VPWRRITADFKGLKLIVNQRITDCRISTSVVPKAEDNKFQIFQELDNRLSSCSSFTICEQYLIA